MQLPKVRSTIHGTENIRYRASSLWPSLPNTLTDRDSLQEFERRLRQLDDICCNCKLYKVIIKDFHFLD